MSEMRKSLFMGTVVFGVANQAIPTKGDMPGRVPGRPGRASGGPTRQRAAASTIAAVTFGALPIRISFPMTITGRFRKVYSSRMYLR